MWWCGLGPLRFSSRAVFRTGEESILFPPSVEPMKFFEIENEVGWGFVYLETVWVYGRTWEVREIVLSWELQFWRCLWLWYLSRHCLAFAGRHYEALFFFYGRALFKRLHSLSAAAVILRTWTGWLFQRCDRGSFYTGRDICLITYNPQAIRPKGV